MQSIYSLDEIEQIEKILNKVLKMPFYGRYQNVKDIQPMLNKYNRLIEKEKIDVKEIIKKEVLNTKYSAYRNFFSVEKIDFTLESDDNFDKVTFHDFAHFTEKTNDFNKELGLELNPVKYQVFKISFAKDKAYSFKMIVRGDKVETYENKVKEITLKVAEEISGKILKKAPYLNMEILVESKTTHYSLVNGAIMAVPSALNSLIRLKIPKMKKNPELIKLKEDAKKVSKEVKNIIFNLKNEMKADKISKMVKLPVKLVNFILKEK